MSDSILDLKTAEQPVPDTGEPDVAQTPDTPADQGSPSPESADWYFAEGIKGEGERPEFLHDRYKSLADQAKAYTDLEKKFGEFRGAPEDGYKLDGIEGLEGDDPLIKHFSETFKDLNLSQQGFERVVNDFVTVQAEAYQANIAEEMKKLGPQAEQTVQQVNNWVSNTFDQETAETIKGWVMTANDVKALEAMRAFQPKSAIPTAEQAMNIGSYESSTEVKNEMTKNWDRYNNDENYRATIKRRLHDSVTRETRGKR